MTPSLFLKDDLFQCLPLGTLGALAKEAAAGGHCSSKAARGQVGSGGQEAGPWTYWSQDSGSPLTILMSELSPSQSCAHIHDAGWEGGCQVLWQAALAGGATWHKVGSGGQLRSQAHPWALCSHSSYPDHWALMGSHQNCSLLSGTSSSGQVTSIAGHCLVVGRQEGQRSSVIPAEAAAAPAAAAVVA